jgi:hypothetical protein
VEQFSHSGATPFGYKPLGKYVGHTGDLPMTDEIYNGTLDHESLNYEAINTIVIQLIKHPSIQQILSPILTEEYFKSAIKCVPEKTVSSYSGQGIHHYKVFSEGSQDGITDLVAAVHAVMMPVPLTVGFFPERWKQAVDVMLEKITRFPRSNKLRIIQLLEADLNQVLRIALARNTSRLAKEHSGIISEHQYGRAKKNCLTPVPKKLLTVQLLIQKSTEGIVFDNDAKGCYNRIISGIALACLQRIGYSQKSARMLGLLLSHLEHHGCTGYGV